MMVIIAGTLVFATIPGLILGETMVERAWVRGRVAAQSLGIAVAYSFAMGVILLLSLIDAEFLIVLALILFTTVGMATAPFLEARRSGDALREKYAFNRRSRALREKRSLGWRSRRK